MAFPWKSSRVRRGLSAGSHTPLPVSVYLQARPGFEDAALPGSAPGCRLGPGPPSAQSPFAPSRCYLDGDDNECHLEGRYPLFVAHTGSCVRPKPSRRLPALATVDGSLQVAASPCWVMPFPTLSLQVFPRMLGPVSRRVVGCTCLFLPPRHRPSPSPAGGSASRVNPLRDFHSGQVFFEIVAIPYVQASRFVRHSGLSHRYSTSAAGQPWLFRPSRTCVVTFTCIGYASRPNQAIDGRGLSPPRLAALSAASRIRALSC